MPDLTLDGPMPPAPLPAPAPLAPAVPAARTLVDVFEQAAGAHPGRLALDAPDGRLTYGELRAHAGALAGRLSAAGAGPGGRVAVRIPSGTAELYTAILAVLLAGAAYVPIDAEDPDDRADRILAGSGAALALGAGGEITTHLPPLRGPVATAPGPQDDAWVIFTSGSTGEPKAVAVTHRSAAAFVDAESRLWTVRPEDRVLAGLSVGFDASCEEIWLAWAHGAALVPAPRALMRSGAELGPWLQDHGVSIVSTVPSLAATWEEASLGGVRLLILGGEACPESLAWRLSERREVWNTYGPTEATVVSTAARLTPGAPVAIGVALAGWETAVLDEAGEPVGPGQPGELVIGGIGLGRYLDPELDAARYPALPALGWPRAYPTGDVVRETPEGLAFVGRRDDQVKLGGRRVELGEIEVALCGVPGVRAACATVRETESGNRVLVGYVTGETRPAVIRRELAERLPAALVPLVIALDALPLTTAGKVDRRALPWPPPLPTASAALRGETERWLAEQFAAQLGPLPLGPDSDFFALGGTSLAAAKLASALRQRFPAAAVADVYHHPGLGELAARLDEIGGAASARPAASAGNRVRGEATRAVGMLGLFSLAAPPWIVVVLALDRLSGLPGPRIGWGWLIGIWLLVASPVGQALLVGGVRRLLMRGVRPGRYPRHGSVACRIWFLERLGESTRLASLAGTPWAVRYARLSGHAVGDGARLGTLPSASGLSRIGAGATLEGDVDLHGWWLDGPELVIDEIEIGPGARIGTRAMLMPGARIGAGAEVEPGSVVDGDVGAGERWAGAPARRVGIAGERWPLLDSPPLTASARVTRLRYGAGLTFASVLPGLAALPGIVLLVAFARERTVGPLLVRLLELAPAAAVSFVVLDALLAALAVRALRGRIRPGWHGEGSVTGWALWLTETVLAGTRGALFPLYSSLFTRPWLRLAGIPVAPRAEISTGIGLSRLTTLADGAFVADDVVFAVSRSRDAWLHVAPITVGEGSFLGNGALLHGGTSLGAGSLVGLLTTAPVDGGEHTSWLGSPPIELPRRALAADPRRTLHPPRRLIAGRCAVELVRILLPASLSAALGMLVYVALTAAGADLGLLGLVVLAPLALVAAGVAAMLLTAVIKWTAIGRYRPGDHPLWSSFVWRDEIVNSAQEQLAGTWLLGNALGTPIMSAYLRLMGARVGRDVHCETLTITEFDVTRLDDGAVVNRSSVVETHLFHDRVMQIGSVRIGAGATLGPSSAVLPDATLGDRCSVGGRSIVMRGETLPPDTRWHGAPVTAVR